MTTTATPTALAFTPAQNEAIKVAAALVRLTWKIVDSEHEAGRDPVQAAVTHTLRQEFSVELVWALELYETRETATTVRALTKLIRAAQKGLAA